MSLEAVTTWRSLLGELVALGDSLCLAIDAGDVLAAISASIQMRRTRSALARIEVPRGERSEREGVAPSGIDVPALDGADAELANAIGDVAELLVRARTAELAMQHWLARPQPADHELLATPLGTAMLADAILPAVWDFESDLVILVGEEVANIGVILGDLGQRRVIAIAAPGALRVESIDEMVSAIRTLVPNPPSQLVVRAAASTPRDQVEEVTATARAALGDLRIHRNTLHAFSRTWIEQGAANLGALGRCASVAALDDAFAGRPMVIVAPGPSLARNVDQLRALQGRAIITAFSHSLKPVLAAGVTPDLVLTVDPQDVRYHFSGCDVSRSWLVNGATVHPALFELPARGFLSLSANCAIDDWIFEGLGDEATVPGGGSVATTAFSLALRWRCDPIVFVGLDLSFPGGNYYVASSSDGDARAVITDGVMRVAGWSRDFHAMKATSNAGTASERVIELPGWHGGTVPSSFMFGLFHRWFVERTRSAGDITVYNCTEGGAHIDGMRHVPLASLAFDRPFDPTAIIDAAGIDRDARTEKLARHLGGFVRGLRRCRSLARRGRLLIERGDTGRELEKVERALATALQPLAFTSLLAQREIDRAHDRAVRGGTHGDYVEASAALLATLDTVIGELEPALVAASNRLGEIP